MPGERIEIPVRKSEMPIDARRRLVLAEIIADIRQWSESPADIISSREQQLFLRAMLRRPSRPMAEIVATLQSKLGAEGISEERRNQIADHIARLAVLIEPETVPDLPAASFELLGDSKPVMPEVVLIDPDSLPESDSVRPDAFSDGPKKPINPGPLPPMGFSPVTITLPSFEDAEQRALIEESKRYFEIQQANILHSSFSLARAAAERWVAHEDNTFLLDNELNPTLGAVLDAREEMEKRYGFPVEFIRGKVTDALRTAYSEALDRAGDNYLGFVNAFQSYVSIRARLGALLRVESRLTPLSSENISDLVAESRMTLQEARNVLGIFDGATRDDVEKAYLIRLQALDFQDGADAIVIGGLMRARETLLEFVEQQEEQRRQEREVADQLPALAVESSDDGPVEISGVDLEPVSPQHKTDSWYIKVLRRPGKILRDLFLGGALVGGAGAGAVALHEFTDVTSGAMSDVPHDYSLGVIPGLFDGVGGGLFPETKKVTPKPIEVPVDEIRLIPHGSWILKETGAMLRERGLRPTPQLTSYFSHLIEAVNAEAIAEAGGANRLPDNFPLVVTPIVAEMNSMVEKKIVGAQAPEASSGVVADSSIEKTTVTYHGRVIPTVDSPMRVMAKGEYLGKVTHGMLRAGGLNWTTARIVGDLRERATADAEALEREAEKGSVTSGRGR